MTSVELHTAKAWERAAIVWEFTYEGVNQYDSAARKPDRQTITAFAGRKIRGLAHKEEGSH
jgi:hypothetical protein